MVTTRPVTIAEFEAEADKLLLSLDPLAAEPATGRLPDAILFKADKMSMAHSLEVRMPFLDRKVVDFALGLPSDMKVRNRQQKYILSLLARRLPSDIRRRRKQGLAYPPHRFAGQPLAGFAREFLLDGASADGLLNRRYLEARLERWLNPRYGQYRRIVMLLFLQSWWNEFFTNRRRAPGGTSSGGRRRRER